MSVMLSGDDKKFIIEFLTDQAMIAPAGSTPFFKDLILQADLPRPVVANRIGALHGVPGFDARNLVEWSLIYGVNPNTRFHVLGSFIQAMTRVVGLEDQLRLAAVVVTYRLLTQSQLDLLRSQFQMPFSFGEIVGSAPERPAAEDERGPAIVWHGEQDELRLQALFPPEPQLLDVSLVMTAAKRALAVCRIEIGGGQKGTGVLVGRDLVLTNYHVMGGNLGAPRGALEENVPATVLRFGAFTNAQTPAETGQTVKLHSDKAIVDADPKFDFVLMRTGHEIDSAADVRPFSDLGPMPMQEDALYMLQHPKGGPMKLALSSNGVTWVDAPAGVIQYLTKADFGSSGSPCFNADWKLIALHHAGSKNKGEGILMESIFGRIQQFLAH